MKNRITIKTLITTGTIVPVLIVVLAGLLIWATIYIIQNWERVMMIYINLPSLG